MMLDGDRWRKRSSQAPLTHVASQNPKVCPKGKIQMSPLIAVSAALIATFGLTAYFSPPPSPPEVSIRVPTAVHEQLVARAADRTRDDGQPYSVERLIVELAQERP